MVELLDNLLALILTWNVYLAGWAVFVLAVVGLLAIFNKFTK